jgi:hypothetical protein
LPVHTHHDRKHENYEEINYTVICLCFDLDRFDLPIGFGTTKPDGSIFLAAGPVLSYYEFKHPMNGRLTDEAWRELLASPAKPDRHRWYQPLMQ